MKFKLFPGYPSYEFKLSKKDKLLLTTFLLCCVLVAYMVGDMIVHGRTSSDLRGKIVNESGVIILCTNDNKTFAPTNGICIE